ncbi:MAG: histidine kinase N-terminal 7TM domain-containing protein, partial [Anaerolineales bacterium]
MNFPYAYTPNIWPSILACLIILGLAFFGYRHRRMPGALPFSIACIFGLLWLLGSIFEFSAVDIAAKIFWRKFQVIFQLPSATAITCFLLDYTWPKRWLTRRNLVLLSIVPALAIVFIITNHIHHLFWEDFYLDVGLVAVPGLLMKYFMAYIYVNFVNNLIIFAWLFIHTPQNRWPVGIMILGQIMMRILYFVDFSDSASLGINYTSLGIAFTSLMYAIVFFRFQLLGPIPLARQAMIEQLPIGVFVLDDQGKIRELNP